MARLKKGQLVYVGAIVIGDAHENKPENEKAYQVVTISNNSDRVFVKPENIIVLEEVSKCQSSPT